VGSLPPVKIIDGASFLFVRHLNLYFVACTRSNANPALVFEFLYQWIRILKSYLGDTFDEESVRNSMTLIYELMDETMDFGYPQVCAVDSLKMYINLGTVRAKDAEDKDAGQLTSQITGIVDWRREGLRFRKNEVYIDVNESVNLLMGANGNVLRNECSGQVIMRTQLSGMPECKFALNDKLNMEKDQGGKQSAEDKRRAVEIDDCTFHRCVRLGKFDSDRTITFVPPDGEFELMRYRVTGNISLVQKTIPRPRIAPERTIKRR
jgi:AP-2 complex subunit mu-1